MRDRSIGLLLFLPVPFVLWLFTRQPLGILPSLGLGVVLVLTHRLYARPFARRHAEERCLWCGGAARGGSELLLLEPGGPSPWRACGRPGHLGRLQRSLGWAARHALFLRAGILGGLALLIGGGLLAAFRAAPECAKDAVALFQIVIAATVMPFGWLGPRGALPDNPGRLPFPVHIQALVGTVAVLWLFRLVGLWWLGVGALGLWQSLA